MRGLLTRRLVLEIHGLAMERERVRPVKCHRCTRHMTGYRVTQNLAYCLVKDCDMSISAVYCQRSRLLVNLLIPHTQVP
jgi:hypothetical protein